MFVFVRRWSITYRHKHALLLCSINGQGGRYGTEEIGVYVQLIIEQIHRRYPNHKTVKVTNKLVFNFELTRNWNFVHFRDFRSYFIPPQMLWNYHINHVAANLWRVVDLECQEIVIYFWVASKCFCITHSSNFSYSSAGIWYGEHLAKPTLIAKVSYVPRALRVI